MMGHGDKLLKFAEELNIGPDEILDFSSNINPLPPEGILKFFRDNLDYLKFYPESSYADVKSVIAETFEIPAGNVMLGNGSIELIRYFFFVLKPSKVMIPYPTFTEFERYAKGINSEILHVNERDIYSGEFISQLDEVDACVICNPNNPTGKIVPHGIIEEAVEEAEKRGCVLLIDMAYSDFVEGIKNPPESESTFITRTLTKILGVPGLRAGYGFAPSRITERIERIRDPWNINSLAVMALKHFVPELEKIKKDVCGKLRNLRMELSARLNSIDGFKALESETHYFLVRHEIMGVIGERLKERKILIRPCDDFRGLDNSYARISVRKREDNIRLYTELNSII